MIDMCCFIPPSNFTLPSLEKRVNDIIDFSLKNLSLDLLSYKEIMLNSIPDKLEFTYLGPSIIKRNVFEVGYNCMLDTGHLKYWFRSYTNYDSRTP